MFLGSTPRVRGTRPLTARAHPHVCGEHIIWCAWRCRGVGSSPRMRGTPGAGYVHEAAHGLIPTCVGSTSAEAAYYAVASAHPHVCGEHLLLPSIACRSSGSSPRVWGARHLVEGYEYPVRLIPTCVGSTRMWSRALTAAEAHPHVCGEHATACGHFADIAGSSPRVWGALP